MAYKATVIQVLIASPGDVSAEREIIREVIHEWNDINAAANQIVLAAVGWDSHAAPEAGAHPQEIINRQIVRDCDLLVGVFWTRLGTPTNKARSGTVEEIEEHVSAGKPAMIYISSAPVAPSSIDLDQYQRLKKWVEELRDKALVQEYSDKDVFRKLFYRQLQHVILRDGQIKRQIESIGHDQADQYDESYRQPDPAPSLSEDAEELLIAASQGKHGTIFKLAFLGGRVVQASGKEYGKGNPREAARWERALEELVDIGYVVGRGYKGEVFELTHEGWQAADKLNQVLDES